MCDRWLLGVECCVLLEQLCALKLKLTLIIAISGIDACAANSGCMEREAIANNEQWQQYGR